MGTDARKCSLRQLIDRVVKTYRRPATSTATSRPPDDAEVFEHELTWMLCTRCSASTRRSGSTWVRRQRSRCPLASPIDSLVSTPAGLLPIGEFVEENAIGAKVYDAHGVTRIVAIKANGVKEVLRLHTKAGYSSTSRPTTWCGGAPAIGTGRFVPAGKSATGRQAGVASARG